MGRETPAALIQHSFTTGEMSPATLGRQDVARYSSGLSKCENFQIAPQGGAYRCPGTVFVAETKNSAKVSRLIDFEFSNNQAYMVEMGDFYARFYTGGGRIESPPGTPVEIATPYAAADIAAIQYCQSADFLYLVHPSYPPAAITRTSNVAWSYVVLTFEDGPYGDANIDSAKTLTASATTGTVTVSSNFSGAFNANMVGGVIRLEEAVTTYYNQWASGIGYPKDYVVSNAGNVYQAANGGGSIPAWAPSSSVVVNTAVISSGNIYSINSTGTTGTHPPAFTTPVTTTVDGISYNYLGAVTDLPLRALGQWQNGVAYPIGYYVFWGQNVYVSTITGGSGTNPPTQTSGIAADGGVTWLFVGLRSGARAPVHMAGTESDGNINWTYLNSGFGYVKITAFIDDQHVTATVISTLPQSVTGGTLNWRLGSWNNSTGYPGAITFFDQRLCFADCLGAPQDIWMSCTGDYYNFAPTTTGQNVLDTNAIHITLASGQVDRIIWLSAQDELLVGTTGGEWLVGKATITKGLSPTNIEAKPQGDRGSTGVPVRRINRATLFIHRSGNRLYELTYNYSVGDSGGYQAKDLNLLADHILRDGGGAIGSAYQQEPFSSVWLLRADGVLAGCAYLADQDVVGWYRMVLKGKVESIATISGGPNGENQLWMIVNRTIGGTTKRYVEYMSGQFYPKTPQDKAAMWYVEAGLSLVSGTPVSTVSGLSHLEGQTVVAIVDGAVQPNVVVSGGSIPLTIAGKSIVVGLPYTSQMTIQPLDTNTQDGTGQGKKKRVDSVVFRILNSLGFSFGMGTAITNNENFRTLNMTMGSSPDLFTGDYEKKLPSSPDRYAQFTVAQTQPYPLNVLAIIPSLTTYDS